MFYKFRASLKGLSLEPSSARLHMLNKIIYHYAKNNTEKDTKDDKHN